MGWQYHVETCSSGMAIPYQVLLMKAVGNGKGTIITTMGTASTTVTLLQYLLLHLLVLQLQWNKNGVVGEWAQRAIDIHVLY